MAGRPTRRSRKVIHKPPSRLTPPDTLLQTRFASRVWMLARRVECVSKPGCCERLWLSAIGDLAIGYSRLHPTAASVGPAITFAGISGSMANHFTAAAGFTSSR
jgi:hypothetical protein